MSKDLKIKTKSNRKQLKILNEITYLANSSLSINEIENFLNIEIGMFDRDYFDRYFKEYSQLLSHLNNLELIAYISFTQNLKLELIKNLLNKIVYPFVLISFAFLTLITFKFSVMPLFESFSDKNFISIINIFFYLSVIVFVILILLLFFAIYIFKKPTYFIILYYRFYQFRILKIIELYYISILSHLLILFDKQGLSTYQTFDLINKFKGNTIIANLAYFVSVDLEKGSGLETSIQNMHINQNFKNVVLLGMKTNNYVKLLSQYSEKTFNDILSEIGFLSKFLLMTSYLYIGIIVLLLYKILSLPIGLIDNI
ncbi:MAG: hypothetical protein GX769_02710 [Erysipelothrix sp.]|nr:hypothetical protein [Erysipelothrix sp.]